MKSVTDHTQAELDEPENRIIPVVGGFAVPKAFSGVGEYLRKNGYTVTSNVEQFLFQNRAFEAFEAFVENVRKHTYYSSLVTTHFIAGQHPSWHAQLTELGERVACHQVW